MKNSNFDQRMQYVKLNKMKTLHIESYFDIIVKKIFPKAAFYKIQFSVKQIN